MVKEKYLLTIYLVGSTFPRRGGYFFAKRIKSSFKTNQTRYLWDCRSCLLWVLVETSMNVTFPTLMHQFNATLSQVQWVTTAYLLAVAATMVIADYIQSNFKTKTIINIGGIAFVLGGLICAFSPSLVLLLIGRIIQAFGTGFAMPLVFSLIMHQVPFNQQGKFTGTAGMVIAMAPSLGPTYGGLVTQTMSWPIIFWITITIGAICWLVASFNMPQNQVLHRRAFPLVQFILITLGLVLIALGFNSAGQHGFTNPQFYMPVLVAIIAIWGFVKLSTQNSNPLLQLKMFKNSTFTKVLAIYFLIQFVQIGMAFLLPNFAQLALGKNSLVSGMLLLTGSLVSAILSPLAGNFMDRVGFNKPLVIGTLFLLISTLCFAIFAQRLNVLTIIIFNVFYMIGFSFMFNNSLTFGLQEVDKSQIGDANAIFNTLQQYSGSLGTTIMAVMLATGSRVLPNANTIHQTLMGNQIAMWTNFGIIIVVIILVISLGRQIQNSKS